LCYILFCFALIWFVHLSLIITYWFLLHMIDL
jgi:hypothetical protein